VLFHPGLYCFALAAFAAILPYLKRLFLMHTISSFRTWASEELKRARVNSPMLTADLLVGYVFGWNRVRILSRGETPISDDDWARLCNLVSRRSNGEPLQYLTGEQEFFGMGFQVTPRC